MKPSLVGCGVLVALAVVALVFALVRLSRGPIAFAAREGSFPEVKVALISVESSAFTLKATLTADVDGFVIRDIAAPRTCAELLGLGAPSGFRPENFPLEDQEGEDPEAIAFAKDYDSKNLRWAGPVPIQFGQPLLLSIPASSPSAGSCTLQIGYERRGHFGGMSAVATVDLGVHS